MKSNKKTFLRYIALALLAVLIGFGMYSLNAARLTGDQVPMPFGIGASVVLSGSMEPALRVGDLLIVQEQDAYSTRDIVVYQSGRMAVVHRIISIDGDMVTTQGDANNVPDEPISMGAIKGEVVAAIPLVGYFVWMLKTPLGVIVTIAAAVVLVELSFRSRKKEKDDEKERMKEEIRRLMQELQEDEKN